MYSSRFVLPMTETGIEPVRGTSTTTGGAAPLDIRQTPSKNEGIAPTHFTVLNPDSGQSDLPNAFRFTESRILIAEPPILPTPRIFVPRPARRLLAAAWSSWPLDQN
jgi:hypothetical protein